MINADGELDDERQCFPLSSLTSIAEEKRSLRGVTKLHGKGKANLGKTAKIVKLEMAARVLITMNNHQLVLNFDELDLQYKIS